MSAIRQIDGGGGAPAKADPAPHALVFDSGVGGLSVLDEVRALMPGARLTYAADNFAFPYGPKPVDELVGRVTSVLRKLVEETQPDVLVIACNTASTQALDAAREMLPMPIVGVVPAVKPAAKASFSRTIGLLATAATVASPYTKSLIEQFADGCRVVCTGAPELVEAAERKLQGEPPDPAILSGALDRMLNAPGGDAIDIVVLGCTHFPLLKPELSAMAAERGRNIAWIDSGAAIARRVRTLFERAGLTPPTSSASAHRAIFTADTPAVERMRSGLAGYGLTEIGFLRV
ncbi:MAG TPA: glutamate racemase [Alphaproteobacteria bacterium]|nr:glutamate racemase [Alphaproteobacteria bacterium]